MDSYSVAVIVYQVSRTRRPNPRHVPALRFASVMMLKAGMAASILFCACSIARAQTAEPAKVLLAPDSTRLLSTQSATANLTVRNDSGTPMRFFPGLLKFFSWNGRAWTDSFYRLPDNFPIPIIIQPAQTYTRDIPMPSCQVLSDPCSQNIMVTAGLNILGTTAEITARSNSVRYEFIPDPTATYQIGNLNGNRPIFLSQGVGRDTILPDYLVIEAGAGASEPQPPFSQAPALANDLAAAFRASGIAIGGVDYDATAQPWQAQVFLDRVAGQRAITASTIQTVRAQFASRITSLVSYFLIDHVTASEFVGRAEADAQQQVSEISLAAGSGNVRTSIAGPYIPGRFTVPNAGEGFPYGDPGTAEDARRLIIHGTTLDLTQVELVRDFVFIGDTPALEQHDPQMDARARRAFADLSSLPAYKSTLKVALAADRPELYVEGGANTAASSRAGLSAPFVAIQAARARAVKFGDALGVDLEHPSLFAPFPRSQGADLVLGMATTIGGTDLKRLKIPPAQTRTVALRDNTRPSSDMLPISIPDDKTVVWETADGSSLEPPDAVRIYLDAQSTALSSDPALGNAPRPEQIVKLLRRLPGLFSAEFKTPPNSDVYNEQYEVTLRPASTAGITAAVDTVKRAYASRPIRVRAGAVGVSTHCGVLERREILEAIRVNLQRAAADAATAHRVLRKLLLAALFPTEVQFDSCSADTANFNAAPLEPEGVTPKLPHVTNMFVTVTLAFRTFPAKM